jgi:hypothetical protein
MLWYSILETRKLIQTQTMPKWIQNPCIGHDWACYNALPFISWPYHFLTQDVSIVSIV